MNRNQFLRALTAYCAEHGFPKPVFNAKRGKGGHGTVTLGSRFMVVPSGELKKGTQEAILKGLGVPKDAF